MYIWPLACSGWMMLKLDLEHFPIGTLEPLSCAKVGPQRSKFLGSTGAKIRRPIVSISGQKYQKASAGCRSQMQKQLGCLTRCADRPGLLLCSARLSAPRPRPFAHRYHLCVTLSRYEYPASDKASAAHLTTRFWRKCLKEHC